MSFETKSDLMQTALNACPPKKAWIEEIVLNLCLGHPVEDYDLARLYAYFMPKAKKTKKPKTAFEWVAGIAPTSNSRSTLNYVYVEPDGTMVATNGFVVLVAENSGKQAGFYRPSDPNTKVFKCQREEGDPTGHPGQYPNWRKVFPTKQGVYRNLSDIHTEVVMFGSKTRLIHLDFGYGDHAWVPEDLWNKALAGFDVEAAGVTAWVDQEDPRNTLVQIQGTKDGANRKALLTGHQKPD